MGLMIPFKCGLHMQRLWPGGRGVLVRCWFSVDPASIRWVGIETTVGRRPVFTVCFVCPLSTRRWPFVCGDTRLDDGGVDPTFGQSFVFSVYPFAIRQWYSGRRGHLFSNGPMPGQRFRYWPGFGPGWANAQSY